MPRVTLACRSHQNGQAAAQGNERKRKRLTTRCLCVYGSTEGATGVNVRQVPSRERYAGSAVEAPARAEIGWSLRTTPLPPRVGRSSGFSAHRIPPSRCSLAVGKGTAMATGKRPVERMRCRHRVTAAGPPRNLTGFPVTSAARRSVRRTTDTLRDTLPTLGPCGQGGRPKSPMRQREFHPIAHSFNTINRRGR